MLFSEITLAALSVSISVTQRENVVKLIVITVQRAVHAEHDIVLQFCLSVGHLSVCLSVCPMPVLCKRMDTPSTRGIILFFFVNFTVITKFQGNPLSGSLNMQGVGKFLQFYLS